MDRQIQQGMAISVAARGIVERSVSTLQEEGMTNCRRHLTSVEGVRNPSITAETHGQVSLQASHHSLSRRRTLLLHLGSTIRAKTKHSSSAYLPAHLPFYLSVCLGRTKAASLRSLSVCPSVRWSAWLALLFGPPSGASSDEGGREPREGARGQGRRADAECAECAGSTTGPGPDCRARPPEAEEVEGGNADWID